MKTLNEINQSFPTERQTGKNCHNYLDVSSLFELLWESKEYVRIQKM